MIGHARAAVPRECCGLVAGRIAGRPLITACVGVANAARGLNRHESDAGALIAAAREVRQLGLDLIGTYHSHPNGEAFPSREDCAKGWQLPFVTLIVSLKDNFPDMRVWSLSPGHAVEVPWWFAGDAAPHAHHCGQLESVDGPPIKSEELSGLPTSLTAQVRCDPARLQS